MASGLTIATVRDVLVHLDAPVDEILDLMAKLQTTLTPVDGPVDRAGVTALMQRWGWEPATASARRFG